MREGACAILVFFQGCPVRVPLKHMLAYWAVDGDDRVFAVPHVRQMPVQRRARAWASGHPVPDICLRGWRWPSGFMCCSYMLAWSASVSVSFRLLDGRAFGGDCWGLESLSRRLHGVKAARSKFSSFTGACSWSSFAKEMRTWDIFIASLSLPYPVVSCSPQLFWSVLPWHSSALGISPVLSLWAVVVQVTPVEGLQMSQKNWILTYLVCSGGAGQDRRAAWVLHSKQHRRFRRMWPLSACPPHGHGVGHGLASPHPQPLHFPVTCSYLLRPPASPLWETWLRLRRWWGVKMRPGKLRWIKLRFGGSRPTGILRSWGVRSSNSVDLGEVDLRESWGVTSSNVCSRWVIFLQKQMI